MVKSLAKLLPLYLLLLVCSFTSCKEEDDKVEEFPNWAAQNDAYFAQLVADVQAKKNEGSTTWDLFASYTKPASNYSYKYSDYVVVEKLENGSATTSPIQTDTVQVHYVGRLIPSADKYKTIGMQFDATYNGSFDPAVASPAKLVVGKVISGFGTAMMHMHKGDHWRVYVPYQLGYGTNASGSIPGGSTLIFDVRLADFWRKR